MTDRLTRIIEDGLIKVLSICQARRGDAAVWKEWSISKDSAIKDALLRLAAYEDTGFEPSEISEREEMFVAYRHICGGKSPEEAQSNFEELSAYRTAEEQRNKGCEWCIGFCPDVTGDPHADYNFCPKCGRKLKEG